jgi:hypothetical protein
VAPAAGAEAAPRTAAPREGTDTGRPASGGAEAPYALRILKRLAAFLLALALIALFFWAAGNFRRFLDDTQLMLLSVLRWSSLGLGSLSLVGAAAGLARPGRLASRLRSAAGWLLLALSGTALALLSEALIVFAAGLR